MFIYRKKIFSLLAVLFLVMPSVTAQEKKFSIEAGPQYRQEDFRWSIAGNIHGTNPNILSELIFNHIHSAGFYTKGTFRFLNKFNAEAYYDKLLTYNGRVTDFDYDGNNRTDPKTQLYLQSRKGHSTEAGAVFSYYFIKNEQFDVSAGAGYSLTKELFYLTDDNDPLLKSTYEAKWNGPRMSWNGLWKNGVLNIGAGITGMYLFYNAKANWNLVETFRHPVSFTHKATGHGFDYRLTLGYQPSDKLQFSLHGLYSDWKTKYGVDKLFKTDGEIISARMNGALKKNSGIRLTTTFSF